MEAVLQAPAVVREIDRPLSSSEIQARLCRLDMALPALASRISPCTLCPRACRALRRQGEFGECGLGADLRVASVARHAGEEPPISGERGIINVFFSGCNLHCLHCQNWPLSQNHVGHNLSAQELADKILQKWRRGAHSLGWVTPTPQIVPALEAYRLCLQQGLDLPLIHNGSGYEDEEIVSLLAGVVDIWLPDAKTGDSERGLRVQGVHDYPVRNQKAISAMVAQVEKGLARAVVVRHLILPDGLEDSLKVLTRLWESFGDQIYLSLLAQYFPTHKTLYDSALDRPVTWQEYERVVDFAQQIGFQRGWIQENEVDHGIPLHCLS